MSLEIDLELRLAAFAHVDRLRRATGGEMEARALNPEIPNGSHFVRSTTGPTMWAFSAWIPSTGFIFAGMCSRSTTDGPMLRQRLQEMHGGLIQVPSRAQHLPQREYPAERFARFLAA
ncbi:MAG: hypothetical protein ACRDJF_06490 [Actinomycetota bacterium]